MSGVVESKYVVRLASLSNYFIVLGWFAAKCEAADMRISTPNCNELLPKVAEVNYLLEIK